MAILNAGRGITRFQDYESHANGFMVRLCRKGFHVNEFFSDSVCGGKMKAKRAAQARYAELLDEYGPIDRQTSKGQITHRNQSGHVGIHIAHDKLLHSPGCEYFAYCASWTTPDRKRKKIAFSWNKYGKELALKMAIYARKKENNIRAAILRRFKTEIAAQQEKLERLPAKEKANIAETRYVKVGGKIEKTTLKKAASKARRSDKTSKKSLRIKPLKTARAR